MKRMMITPPLRFAESSSFCKGSKNWENFFSTLYVNTVTLF
jgi:hypothetical protein